MSVVLRIGAVQSESTALKMAAGTEWVIDVKLLFGNMACEKYDIWYFQTGIRNLDESVIPKEDVSFRKWCR